ncbi:MAG: SusD/RagB family nutrient-binding outer membrane lipoprotein [Bacteroidetes bacterium]|nr:SusD/RagB family nutrient-binding outer membrane lipoprotein [Bacteroidota bacterium]
MKNYKNILIMAIGLSLTLMACNKEKFFDKNINTDPTALSTAEPSVLLPAAQGNIAYNYAGDLSRFSGLFTQQLNGSSNQFASYDIYNFTNADFGNVWKAIYSSSLNNLDKLIKNANSRKYAYYEGMGKIMMAYTLVVTADMWGDIPYSEALKGVDNLNPHYDKGADVYTRAHKLIDEGLVLLATPDVDAGVLPASDDLIYNGDVSKWILFAHGIKARMYLHTVNIDPSALQKGIDEVALSIASAADEAKITPLSPSTNPMFQFQENRNGDITYLGSYMSNMMINDTDARVDAWIDTSADAVGPAFGGMNAPIYLLSYTELKFIEAELRARGNLIGASEAYTAAVQASFAMAGVSGSSDILKKYPYDPSKTNVLDRIMPIMMQKYVALFASPETFSDWRRTSFPNLTPKAGSDIPRRLLYPDAETNTNLNMPQNLTLFSKIWWDK